MFSIREKKMIADAVQLLLRGTEHPELPRSGEIKFTLRVEGAEAWSWAVIQNNGSVEEPKMNVWNESQDPQGLREKK
jgi:hypothetical protein